MGIISIAVMLLALTGGMFLLAKTQKDGLNVFFKVMSWFVIVLSLGAILCCGIRCVARGCGKKEGGCHKEMMMRGECENDGGCGMHRSKMIMRKCMMEGVENGDGECKKDGMCKHGGEGEMGGCSIGMSKCEKRIVKDTVIIKK